MSPSENTNYVDGLLLQALQQDDEQALRHLFDTYYNKLFRAGIRWGTDSHLTQECIQAVFQDVWQYRKTLGPIASIEGYLVASLKKRIARQVARQRPFATQLLEDIPLPTESYESILIEQEENEARKTELQKALNTLTPRQKEVISMKYFDELSYREIAEKTGLQVDTLYKILHEGIQRLKTVLSAD